MSSLPGLTLESFLMWELDLIVDGDTSANPSLQIAEALGASVKERLTLSRVQFEPLLGLFAPYRERIEEMLSDFDEDNQSWRDYAPGVSSVASEATWKMAKTFVQGWRRLFAAVAAGEVDVPEPTLQKTFSDVRISSIPGMSLPLTVSEMTESYLPPYEAASYPEAEVQVDYTNYRGERAIRRVIPMALVLGKNKYHPELQWLLQVYDTEKQAYRTYAFAGIHRWGPKLRKLGEGFQGNFHQFYDLSVSAVDLMEGCVRMSVAGHTYGTTNWAACMLAHLKEVSQLQPNPVQQENAELKALLQEAHSYVREGTWKGSPLGQKAARELAERIEAKMPRVQPDDNAQG